MTPEKVALAVNIEPEILTNESVRAALEIVRQRIAERRSTYLNLQDKERELSSAKDGLREIVNNVRRELHNDNDLLRDCLNGERQTIEQELSGLSSAEQYRYLYSPYV